MAATSSSAFPPPLSAAPPSGSAQLAPDTGHPWLTRLLTSRRRCAQAAAASVLFQIGFSLAEATACGGRHAGRYAGALDWWMLFVVVFPATLIVAPRIDEATRRGLTTLASQKLAIARARSGFEQSPAGFLAALAGRMSPAPAALFTGAATRPGRGADDAVVRFRLVVLLSVVICATDCLASKRHSSVFANEHAPLMALPYAAQALVIVVMIFTLHRFCRVLDAVLDELEARPGRRDGKVASRFAFVPLALDPARRLGLGPLARPFDHALVVSALLAAYAVVVRLELGEWGVQGALFHNLRLLVEMPWKDALLSSDAYRLGLGEGGTWGGWFVRFVPAIAATIVLAAMVWFPLYRWRALAGRWKARAWREAAEAVREAERAARVEDGAEQQQRALDRRLKVLAAVNESTVWPNGAERASVLLGINAALVVVAWFPNLLVLVLTSGLVLRFLGGAQSLVARFTEGRS